MQRRDTTPMCEAREAESMRRTAQEKQKVRGARRIKRKQLDKLQQTYRQWQTGYTNYDQK